MKYGRNDDCRKEGDFVIRCTIEELYNEMCKLEREMKAGSLHLAYSLQVLVNVGLDPVMNKEIPLAIKLRE